MATQHVGTDYSKSLTSVLDSAEHIWFLFFSLECLVEIGSLRGWNCFWPFLWSWVSPLRFAKWTGSIRGHRGARRRVLLKGDGRKTTWRSPPCLPPFSFSTTGLLQRDGDTYRPCMEAPRVGLQSPNQNKQADGERAECARRPRWLTRAPSSHGGRVISNQKPGIRDSKLQTINRKVQFSMISGINMKVSLVPFLGGNPDLMATD